jgi:cytochrome c peroxidase
LGSELNVKGQGSAIGTIKKGEFAGVGSENPLKSNFVSGFKLTVQEQRDLLAFLKSLTEVELINNPAFRDPTLP